jgi:hypothetical protein
MLDSHLLLALGAIFLQRRHLGGEGANELIERPLGAVLLRDVLNMRQAAGERHGRHVHRRHLSRQHGLDLIARLDVFSPLASNRAR